MKKLYQNDHYFVRIVPFPVDSIGGMVTPNDDGTFTIYLNANLNRERQMKAFRHELAHIANGDFWNDRSIEEVEDI